MSCRRSNSGYRQLYRSPGNRWSVDLVLWPRIDLVAVFALGRLTSAPRRWEDRQFGAGSLDVSGTCAPGRAALSREGPRVRIPPPPPGVHCEPDFLSEAGMPAAADALRRKCDSRIVRHH